MSVSVGISTFCIVSWGASNLHSSIFRGESFLAEDHLVDAVGKAGELEFALFIGLHAVAAARGDIAKINQDPLNGDFLGIQDLAVKVILPVLGGRGKDLDEGQDRRDKTRQSDRSVFHDGLLFNGFV